MKNTKFEVGNIYTMNFIGDSELKPKFICTKITPKTATFESTSNKEVLRKKIRVHNDIEYILAGAYSMAPTISADKVVA